MRILYFEDDAIDQRLFKRACKNISDLEVTYYDSCMGLQEAYINSYDGIIIDQFLRDCSAVQFRDKNISIPMAVLSASEKLAGSNVGFVGVWQKPVKEQLLLEILDALNTSRAKENSSISLEYIEELTDGDEEEKLDLLKSIYESIIAQNDQLKSFDILDEQALQQCLHKQKSKIGIFYLEQLHQQIDQSENELKNGAVKASVKNNVEQIVQATDVVLLELKKHLN